MSNLIPKVEKLYSSQQMNMEVLTNLIGKLIVVFKNETKWFFFQFMGIIFIFTNDYCH